MANLQITVASRQDLPRSTEIYNHSVLTTAITFDLEPVTTKQRSACFDEHAENGRQRLLVAEEEEQPCDRIRPLRTIPHEACVYDTTVETSIYCAPEAVGRASAAPFTARCSRR
jgi:phosphinothricin acetyltransferase